METIITNINDCSEINIYYQDEINLEVDVSLLYIKSGQKEIENYVEHVSKPEINNYIDNYAKPIVSEVIDNIATPQIDDYLNNKTKPAITDYANNAIAIFNSNAAEKQIMVDNSAQQAVEQAAVSVLKAEEASSSAAEARDSQVSASNSADSAANSALISAQIADNINPDQFVKNTGNQIVNGVKTFTDNIVIHNQDGQNSHLALADATEGSRIELFQATSNGVNQLLIRFDNGNKYPFLIEQSGIDNNKFRCRVNNDPDANSNNADIATTSWVRKKLFGINYASPTVRVSDGGTWAQDSTYTAPSQGYAIITSKGANCQIRVNDLIVGRTTTDGGSGWTSSVSNVFLPLNKGDVVKAYGGSLTECRFYFWTL